ncbi:MAG: lipoyl(octanoyl) transferase LipB [Myxococcales bacterium]|nr:lipoyl(octanoyl) transferase LipB [Myxococcales bacterium]
MQLRHPTSDHLPDSSVVGRKLCDYANALAAMESLVSRPHDAPDVLLSVEHPPTITVGRRGADNAIHGRTLHLPDGERYPVAIHEVARGGSVTYHAPGQLVIYPIVQLPKLAGPIGRGPLGDLGKYVRTLEQCMVETCAAFELSVRVRPGFSGIWLDERTKLASIGVGIRAGWSFHGLALNVNPHLEGFDLITPCGLSGVQMTSLWQQLEQQNLPTPSFADVEADLVARLGQALVRG